MRRSSSGSRSSWRRRAGEGRRNDPDAGESFASVVSARPDHGIATVNTRGLVTYTPDVGFTGPDSVDVTVIDNNLVPLTGTVTIAVTVTGRPNTAPAPT